MIISLALIVVGFVLLIYGANWLVSGSSSLAKKFNISDLVIGLTVVAFGTSAPEMVVNIIASINGQSDIVLSNIIGSNNFNLFIILGVAGLIYPITVQSTTAWKEIPISIVVVLIFTLLSFNFFLNKDNTISRLDGIILLVLFGVFLYYIFIQTKNQEEQESETKVTKNGLIFVMIVGGLAGLVLGGKLVVDNAIKIAETLGVSQRLIGLTIVAAGTSLPELATSIVAATKKNSDIAIGNVIGSNIFNILLVLGTSVVISPIVFPASLNIDLYVLIIGSIILFIAMLTGVRKKLDRWEAGLLFAFYIGYTIWLILKEI